VFLLFFFVVSGCCAEDSARVPFFRVYEDAGYTIDTREDISNEYLVTENLGLHRGAKFPNNIDYDTILQRINHFLGIYDFSVRLKTDVPSPMYWPYLMDYFEHREQSPFQWQYESCSMKPPEGVWFSDKWTENESLFGTVSLTLMRGERITAGYSLGGKFSMRSFSTGNGTVRDSSQVTDVMWGILGVVGSGVGAGVVIKTDHWVRYDRFLIPTAD
jgi:hypothetical protein